MYRTMIHEVFDEAERDCLSLKGIYDKLNSIHQLKARSEMLDGIPELWTDWSDRVLQIERFMLYIEKLEVLPYMIDDGTRLNYEYIIRMMRLWNIWVSDFSSAFYYSPYVEQFYQTTISFPEAIESRCLPLTERSGEDIARTVNNYITTLQDAMRSRAFKEKIRHRDDHSRRMFISAIEYLDFLFNQHKRMVVLRMDFYLAADAGIGLAGPLVPLLEYFGCLREDMKRRVGVFQHLTGYIAHVEYGYQKKHHIHAIFFFDGDKVRNDYALSQLIVQRWVEITRGSGHYFNTQEKAGQYACPAIGMVHRDDREKRQCLIYVIWYITKLDQFLPYKYSDKQRLLFRGEIKHKNN